MTHYERLSALDAAFLTIETPSYHMHAALLMVLEAKPLTLAHGGLDITRIIDYVAHRIESLPRYRQRIEHVPLQRQPVWVDDESFNIQYHVRHTALPRPGTVAQLHQLVGRILSQKLDRTRPLWELWVIEGLDQQRFALLGKVHHCILDGIAGVNVMSAFFSPHATDSAGTSEATPTPTSASVPAPQQEPRPTPSGMELFTDELRRKATHARRLLQSVEKFRDDPQRAIEALRGAATSVASTVSAGASPASRTPLNPEQVGAYRRFVSLRFDLQSIRELGKAANATVNDVVLALVAGALRRFLLRREVDPATLDFRVMMPVTLRPGGPQRSAGNRVSLMFSRLPLDQADPFERLRHVCGVTKQAKQSRQAQGAELLGDLGNVTSAGWLGRAIQLGVRLRPYNLVVTNVPGPAQALYLLGAQLLEAYPVVPLYVHQGLGIALFSYHGGLYWGLNADWDALPDLELLCDDLLVELDALQQAIAAHSAMNLPFRNSEG